VAPSARQASAILACVSVAGALIVLSGCDTTTTQTKSARAELQIQRNLAAAEETKLTGNAPGVKVLNATAIRGKKGGAIALVVRNTGSKTINDLPVGVGVGTAGKSPYLNLAKRVPYFQSHLPAIAPGEKATWVFTSEKPLPAGDAFAKVGGPPKEPLATVGTPPEMATADARGKTEKDSSVIEARVSNDSDIPQLDVEVYASASKGDQLVAAGATKVGEIAPGQELTVHIPVAGSLDGAKAAAFAPPTIFD
jgi:hypothetical protein